MLLIEMKVQSLVPVKEHMTMEKRKQLRMFTRDAVSLRQLSKEVRIITDMYQGYSLVHLLLSLRMLSWKCKKPKTL